MGRLATDDVNRSVQILHALLTSTDLENNAEISVCNSIQQGGLNIDDIVQGRGAELIRDSAPGAN